MRCTANVCLASKKVLLRGVWAVKTLRLLKKKTLAFHHWKASGRRAENQSMIFLWVGLIVGEHPAHRLPYM